MVTSNPGYDMMKLLRTVWNWDWGRRLCMKFFLFCSNCFRFTETAAAPSADSSCSPTTSRSIMCLSQVSPPFTCCWRWVWTRWERITLTTSLVTSHSSLSLLYFFTCDSKFYTDLLWYSTVCNYVFVLRSRIDDSKPLGKLQTILLTTAQVAVHKTQNIFLHSVITWAQRLICRSKWSVWENCTICWK